MAALEESLAAVKGEPLAAGSKKSSPAKKAPAKKTAAKKSTGTKRSRSKTAAKSR
jgi:hypothetical protein